MLTQEQRPRERNWWVRRLGQGGEPSPRSGVGLGARTEYLAGRVHGAKRYGGGTPMIRLVIMRHGESTSDLEPRRIEGMADFPLSDAGRAQAEALARRIASEYQLDELICSPLLRARQTAEVISRASGVKVVEDIRLREKSYGILGGLTFQEAEERFPTYDGRHLQVHEALPEGESFLQQFERVAEFWYSLYYGKDDRSLGIVTHGGVIQCLYRAALGLSVDSPHVFSNGDTAVHEWLVQPGGAVRVVFANCTGHLRAYPV